MNGGHKIGLALGGGAARGISHLGALEVMEQVGLQVYAVAGTSMGAMVGALYLLEGDTARLRERMYRFFQTDAFKAARFDVLREQRPEDDDNWFESVTGLIRRGLRYSLSVSRQSIVERETFEKILVELVPDIKIEDLPKPFAATSLDVISGSELIWNKGSLRDALWATSAIPGFFPPLELDNMILIDGAWTNAVPVEPCRDLGADRVIAIDISRLQDGMIEYKRGISLIMRAALLTGKHLRDRQLATADVVIRPDVGAIHWADFQNPEALVQKGRDATIVHLDEIRDLIRAATPRPAASIADRLRRSIIAGARTVQDLLADQHDKVSVSPQEKSHEKNG